MLDLGPLYEAAFEQGGLKQGRFDLVLLNTDWLTMAAEDGHVQDLAPRLAEQAPPDYPDGWPASLIEAQQIAEGVYGLPFHDGPQCLIYRKDLFEDAGLAERHKAAHGEALHVPETWEAFHRVAHTMTDAEAGRYGTCLAAYPDGHNTVYDFCIHLWTRGGALLDERGHPTLQTPAATAALDFYRQLVADNSTTCPDAMQIDSVRSGELFGEGKVALMTNWFGFASYCHTGGGDAVRGKVGVAPIPAGPGGTSGSLNVYWLIALASGSRSPELAHQFMCHALSPAMDKLLTHEGAVGCRRSTWSAPDIQDEVPFYDQLDRLHEGARMLPLDRRFPALAHVIERAVLRSIETDERSDKVLAEAQREAEGVWT